MEKLSIVDSEQKIDLEDNKSDKAVIGLKTILEVVPFGSLFSEIITTVIPNQRMERVVLFVEILNDKLKHLEKDIVEQKTKTAEFTDLLQDGIQQASRALSKERLEYITSILKNSLTDEELQHIEKKKLLSLLNELNDVEIIWLNYLSLHIENQDEFFEKHKVILTPVATSIQSPKPEYNKLAIQQSYKAKLLELGLLKEKYKPIKKGEIPEFDEQTGRMKASYVVSTALGVMLLEYMDLMKSDY